MSQDNKGPLTLILFWVGQAIAIPVVGLRLWTRVFIKRSPGLDDLTILVSLAVMIGCTVFVTYQYDNGFGQHFYDLSPQQRAGVMRWLTAAEIGSFISLFFLRLSVCIFLFRLIAGLRIWTRTFLFVISAINFCSCLIICVIYGTQCKPLSNTWNRAFNEELGAQCYSMEMLTAALRFYGGISVCIDVMCALVPMAIIQHLEMEKKTKYALYFILGLAFVPGGMAIGKTVTGNKPTMDPSYVWVSTELFAGWESFTGLVVASLPALHQLFGVVKAKTSKKSSTYTDPKSHLPMPLHRLSHTGSRQSMLQKKESSSSCGPDSATEQAWLATATGNPNQTLQINKRTDISVDLEPAAYAMEDRSRMSAKGSNESYNVEKEKDPGRPQDDVDLADALMNKNSMTPQQPCSAIVRDTGRDVSDTERQDTDLSRFNRAMKSHDTFLTSASPE